MGRLVVACLLALAFPALASARPAPVTWCGTDEVTANRVPDLEVSSADQVRFVYAIPSDGSDNFLSDASGIATDAAWIDQWWQAQDPTRTPRFDRYPFPGCTSTFGALDIGFVRLPHPASYYAADQSPGPRIGDDLRSTWPARQKTIVYFDGPVTDGSVCGETDYQAAQSGGRYGMAFVYLRSDCGLVPPGSGGSAEVAAHELLHNLGAVPDGAPHDCGGANAGHVCDSATDILYPYLGDGSTLDAVTLDYNRDDYYGHSGSWWDVRSSAWLSHLPQFPLTLAVSGKGRLSARTPSSSLDCASGCATVPLDNGTTVTVTATPAAGFRFAGWSGGACSGTAPTCTIGMNQAASATAAFAVAPVRLAASVTGRGRVASSPAGISCPGACTHAFAGGTSVRFTATPAAGWRFAGWSGACSGRGACRVVADAARAVRGRFARR